MIELTLDQAQAVALGTDPPPIVLNPQTQKEYVLLPREEYERLKNLYDDSPWTEEEMELLAGENADLLGWEGMEAYQDLQP